MEVTTQSSAGRAETSFIPPALDTVESVEGREPVGHRPASTYVVLEYPPNFRLTDPSWNSYQSRKAQVPSDSLPGHGGANREHIALTMTGRGRGQAECFSRARTYTQFLLWRETQK